MPSGTFCESDDQRLPDLIIWKNWNRENDAHRSEESNQEERVKEQRERKNSKVAKKYRHQRREGEKEIGDNQKNKEKI